MVTNQIEKGGFAQEPDLAHRRRRPRSPRDGRTIETIGHYNPQTDPSVIVIDEERARHWLEHGAQPTRTVATLLRTKGIEAAGS